MKYSVYKKKTTNLNRLMIAGVIAATGFAPISFSSLAFAKGGVKTPDPVTVCDPIKNFDVTDGDFTGGYAIFAKIQEQQCVSGKTRVRISGTNTSTGRTEFATPVDFNGTQVFFYGVQRSTNYEIKFTITSDRDGQLLSSRSVFVTTRAE